MLFQESGFSKHFSLIDIESVSTAVTDSSLNSVALKNPLAEFLNHSNLKRQLIQGMGTNLCEFQCELQMKNYSNTQLKYYNDKDNSINFNDNRNNIVRA